MGSVTLSGQSLFTVDEALRFLQDQGTTTDDNDLLRHHINGVTAMVMQITGRDRLVWVDDDEITEWPKGLGTPRIWLKNAPVRKIVSVSLVPHSSTPVAVTVPTEPATFSDEMYFNPVSGEVVLTSRVWPEGSDAKVVYEAGYYKQDSPSSGSPADRQFLSLKLIALNALAAKWARWKNQKHGVASESRGESTISYSNEDFQDHEIREMKRHRRHLYA